MSIQEISIKFKSFFGNTEYMLTGLIVFVSLVSFYLGRMSVEDAPQIPIQEAVSATVYATQNTKSQFLATEKATTTPEENIQSATMYIGSKNGTKYHLPWCPGAKQIKEENVISFSSKEEAEKAGYSPASNCKGI